MTTPNRSLNILNICLAIGLLAATASSATAGVQPTTTMSVMMTTGVAPTAVNHVLIGSNATPAGSDDSIIGGSAPTGDLSADSIIGGVLIPTD